MHLAPELAAAPLHQAHFGLDPLEAILIFAIVPGAIDEPGVAFLCDDIHSLVHPARGIDRRMRRTDGFRRNRPVVDGIELAFKLEILVQPHALHHLDELVHAPVARFATGKQFPEDFEFLRTRTVDNVDAEAPAADPVDRSRVFCDNSAGP